MSVKCIYVNNLVYVLCWFYELATVEAVSFSCENNVQRKESFLIITAHCHVSFTFS